MGNFYFLDKDGNIIHNLTQWDINQKLIIEIVQNISTAPKVHFCNKNSEKALVVQSAISGDRIIADIPNILLEEPLNIIAYVYYNNDSANNSWKTIQTIDIPLRKRAKPDDYEYVENVHVIYLSDLIKTVETLENEVESAETIRNQNENIRINNENVRVQQEEQREQRIEQAIKNTNDATKKAVDAATEVMNLQVTETVNQAVAKAETATSNANQASEKANLASSQANILINDLQKYGAVVVDNVEPESENIDVWINDLIHEEYTLPEINDSSISEADTWSSKKINEEFAKRLVVSDEESNAYLNI